MTNLHKEIVELQKVRKVMDKMSIELQDDNWLSNLCSEVSYSLTIAIKDMVRVSKILRERDLEQKLGYVPRPIKEFTNPFEKEKKDEK